MAQETTSAVNEFWQKTKDLSGSKRVAVGASIGALVTTGILLYKYCARHHDNIPTLCPEKFVFLQGHLPFMQSLRNSEYSFTEWLYEEIKKAGYPTACSIGRPPRTNLVFISHPELIKYFMETNFECTEKSETFRQRFEELLGDGIFAVNGKRWRFHRKVASRMFSTRNLKNYMFDTTIKNTKTMMEKLATFNQKTIDINDLLGRFTADTFCEIAFGQCIGSVATYPETNAFGVAFDNLVENVTRRAGDVFWKTKRVFNVGNEAQIHQDHQVIKQFVDRLVQKKNAYSSKMSDETGSEQYDILSLYLKHDPSLSTKDLYDISLNFIIAGRDTTRMLLAWWIWRLCKPENQSIVEKLYDEVDQFQRTPTYSDFMQSFKYLEKTLCESLRLNPSVPFIGRTCVCDTTLPKVSGDDRQYTIRKHDLVLVNNYAQARNPKVWGDDAEEYNPDRWTKGLNTFDQYTFTAFNVNPRLCLGKSFAIQEAKIFGYYFLKNFKFEMVKGHRVRMRSGAISNMENGLPVVLTARK